MNFKYDREKELEIFKLHQHKFKKLLGRVLEEELNEIVLPNLDPLVSKIARDWAKVEDNFLKQLGKFYDRKLEKLDLTAYLVRFGLCPYNFDEGWFAVPFFVHPTERNAVAMHELCHFYQPIKLKRGIKEAIPVILNDHKTFQMFSFDRGHKEPKEQEWRKKIWELYKEGKNFWQIKEELGFKEDEEGE